MNYTFDPNKERLLAALRALEEKTNQQWISSLSPRKLAELKFHDRKRISQPQDANKKYYATVTLSEEYTQRWITTHAKGKVFLDYACGNGEDAILAASSGAELAIGLDISRVSIENCRKRANDLDISANTFFVQGDCENTGLPDSSIDVVVCSGMLHHLDLNHAFLELVRIMKPGAVCLAIEALNYNPIIKLYRQLTPNLRTEWEKSHILSFKDLQFARKFFHVRNIRYWHLFSILTTPLRNTSVFDFALKCTNVIDSFVLALRPFSLLAWMFTFELVKSNKAQSE